MGLRFLFLREKKLEKMDLSFHRETNTRKLKCTSLNALGYVEFFSISTIYKKQNFTNVLMCNGARSS